MSGLTRIATAFQRARGAGRAALLPYFTLGFPTPEASLDVVAAIAAAGADLIELGLPFSDPLADGSSIQRSTQVALKNGTNLAGCLAQVRSLRGRGIEQPFLLMGYINPILAYGPERFAAEAAAAGADGLIVPDLPPEEAGDLEVACREHGQALVYLVAPTTPAARLKQVAARSSGFLYLASLAGVTGARRTVAPGLAAFVARARRATSLPLAVGFGISTPAQAGEVGRLADGVIVGSALVDAVGRGENGGAFVASLRARLEEPG
ncbi:MAG: tryptophan synthase subunit alpha [Anaerolineales bacterium]|nr:tryptophan synthase subunit alpha [Anaerolineales bacterium]